MLSLPKTAKLYRSEASRDVNYLANANTPPLATPFKPAVKLLSRKPAPQSIVKKDPVTGLEQLVLVDDEDEEDDSKKHQPTPEEIRQRQQRELEEKQRRYNEARAKIFGESNITSGHLTTGVVTDGRHRGRGRGSRGSGDHRNNARQDDQTRRPPPSAQPPSARELFDPHYSSKPISIVSKRGGDASPQSGSRSSTPHVEDQAIRAPRGPDSSGRGGFGLARRGARGG